MINCSILSEKIKGGARNFGLDSNFSQLLANGYKNVGNTCFLNSVTQATTGSEQFLSFVFSEENISEFESQNNSDLTHLLWKTFQISYTRQDTTPVPPIIEYSPLRKKFLNYEQQDAHEFFQHLITFFSEEVEKRSHLHPLISIINSNATRALFFCSLYASMQAHAESKIPMSLDDTPYTGYLRGTLQCNKCSQMFETNYQKFIDISLSIHGSTLADCLEYFTQTENVSEIICDNCKPNRPSGKKQLNIARGPNILCLHLRRLVHTSRGSEKLNTHISFPFHLDLDPYCTNFRTPESSTKAEIASKFFSSNGSILGGSDFVRPSNSLFLPNLSSTSSNPYRLPMESSKDMGSLFYNLSSVIVHSGNHRGGHYTVFRKAVKLHPSEKDLLQSLYQIRNTPTDNSTWLYISDHEVRNATESEVLGSQAYMLFYEKEK